MINQGPHQMQNYASIKEVLVLVLAVSFSCFLSFSLVLDPRDITEGLAGKVGNAWRKFEDNEGSISGKRF